MSITPGYQTRIYNICPVTVLAFGIFAPILLIPILGRLGALGFLASGLVLLCVWPQRSYAAFMTHWAVLLLPIYALISMLWSLYPGVTFRHALQLGFTVAVAIAVGYRLGPRRCMYVLFAAFGAVALLSLTIGKARFDGALLGIFGSKNAFAGAMSTFVILALAVAMDRRAAKWLRVTGVISLLIGMRLLLGAQSAGQTLLTLPGLILVPVLLMLRRFSTGARAVILTATGLILILGLIAALNLQDQIASFVLAETGKDTTLTGRTDIWAVGISYIAERPILGVGYQAFWVEGHNSAEQLWAAFGIEERGGFNFHNMLIAAWVEGGIIGAGLQMWILLAGLILCAKWALKTATAESAFFTSFIFVKAITGVVEVPAFTHFSATSMMLICGYIYGIRALYIARAPKMRPKPLLLLGEQNAILRP
ncbi:O-antigen ligase family protein [Parasulfitobacter algicola]|uniref:O-antigen ligase family protein n=1 Tax=Parasulfitobacter algicola TaxID=2614809 RepID=A0ABX2IPT3_9RHOB|nr:O-antigen ligase family protein [Sulfitobacter algicola]NSX54901.1 O-antigen ligase family protein [Sulfitobacter algicola]